MTFWETIERGEYVMIALAVILIIAVCILWIRGASLRKERKTYPGMMHRVRDHIVEGDLDNSKQICQSFSNSGAAMLEAGIDRIGKPMGEVKAAMDSRGDVLKSKMGAGIIWLKCLAVVSPLLGFGGTLVGIIDRLRDFVNEGQPAEIAALCNQIAPTIVTTVCGLGVGIFCLIASTSLESCVATARRKLDELAADFTDLLNEPS